MWWLLGCSGCGGCWDVVGGGYSGLCFVFVLFLGPAVGGVGEIAGVRYWGVVGVVVVGV